MVWATIESDAEPPMLNKMRVELLLNAKNFGSSMSYVDV